MLGRPRPTTPLPIQRLPSLEAFSPAHCVPVSRVGQPTPGLARPSCPCLSRRPCHPSLRPMHRDAGYVPRQRSGQVPLPVGSAPHNPDHSRQHVGTSQPGADGSASTPGLDSSPGPSVACPSITDINPQTPTHNRRWNIRLWRIRLRRTQCPWTLADMPPRLRDTLPVTQSPTPRP